MIQRCLPIAVLLLAGCAAATPGYSPYGEQRKAPESGEVDGRGSYNLSSIEKTLDCKKLAGSMQITIARLKDRATQQQPSDLSTGMRKSVAPVFGGSSYNTDPSGEVAREKAKLQAYNRELASKGCKTIDIDAELAKPPEGPRKY